MSAEKVPSPGQAPAVRFAVRGLLVLTLINMFNYLDRFVVSALVESLKRSELHPTDAQLGSLMTGFIVVYMLTSPLFGVLGDRGNRPRLLALGVAIWSLATAFAGFARSFSALFVARAAVGIGEAAYGTIAPSLLSDSFPRERRGRVLAFFFCAIPIGSALGYIVGGWVDHHWGWRNAFFVAGLPGLALALLALTLSDPPRGGQDPEEARPAGAGGWSVYRELFRNRWYRLNILGYAAYTFALGGMAFWFPAFLERARGVPSSEATVQFGSIVVVTGFVGTFGGGFLGDWLLKRTPEGYMWLSGLSALAATPLALVALTARSPAVYLPALVLAEILIFSSTGPVNSALMNDVHPWQRAGAVAACNFTIHVLGDVPSPPLVGLLSDASSLDRAVLILPVALAVAGLIWTWAAVARTRDRRAGRA